MIIADATPGDVSGITAIYNHAVQHTTAIWNETVVDAADRAAWLGAKGRAGHPVLVARDETGAVIGYATFGDWRPHDGYRHTVEHSVYARADRQGEGIGSALMTELIARARRQGKHVMVAAIDAQNAPSTRLHERLGFERAGTLRQVGTKFGTWLDLTFLQLVLDDRPAPTA